MLSGRYTIKHGLHTMSQSGIKHIWFFRPTFPSIKESPFSCNWGDLMIIKNSMLGWSAGWWLGSCTQHQDNDKLWTSGGHQCKYGGAKTGAVVITPAIFSFHLTFWWRWWRKTKMHSATLLGPDPEIMSWSAFILICLESGSIFVTRYM